MCLYISAFLTAGKAHKGGMRTKKNLYLHIKPTKITKEGPSSVFQKEILQLFVLTKFTGGYFHVCLVCFNQLNNITFISIICVTVWAILCVLTQSDPLCQLSRKAQVVTRFLGMVSHYQMQSHSGPIPFEFRMRFKQLWITLSLT